MIGRWRAGACLLGVAMLACGAGCDKSGDADTSKSAAPAAEQKEPPKPVEVRLNKDAIEENHVTVGKAERRVLVPTFSAPARVAFNAEAMAHVGAPVAGRVAELKARLGDDVKAGDELFVVESPDLGEAQSDYLQKRTALAAAKAAVEPLKIAAERGRTLYEQSQGLALAEVQKREAEYKAAQVGVQAAAGAATGAANRLHLMGMGDDAIKELENTGKLTPRYSVRTPVSGRVIEFDLTLGALVGPDKDLQVEVADLAKVWVIADVPEAYYGQLKKGAAARVAVAALGGQKFDGKVTMIAPALDPTTRTVQTRIEVANPEKVLRPGMLARAEIESSEFSGAAVVALPSDAVVTIEDDTLVFVPVEGEKGKFKRRDVKAGEGVGGWTQILSGLKEGEPVVVRGAIILKAQLAKPQEAD